MAEGGVRIGGFGSGLAVILTEDDNQKAHLISSCDDIGRQPIEQTLEYIFDLPHKSIHPLSSTSVTVDAHASSILMKVVKKYRDFDRASRNNRDGISIIDIGYGPHTIAINEASICGDIRVIKQPLLLESAATFSSARANACAHEGKWMYEVILETAGVQQLGWAAVYCQFTDRRGVGDAEDSYSFDGSRVTKWNKEPEAYGQSWVVGDVIGCCIDLDDDGISFYRNGVSLGLAFDKIRKMGPGLGYYPAISLSQGERCSLNFGALPFKYPIEGFLSLQSPPSVNSLATHLLKCLSRLLELQYLENFKSTSVERMRRLKRFQPLEVYYPISCMICQEFFSAVNKELGSSEYIMWGPFTLFLMEVFGKQAPHDYVSLDRVMDLFLEFRGSRLMFQHVINALSCSCKTASLVLMDCPYSGSYAYLSLACHILKREELMTLWWRSLDFEFSLEGFLSRKGPNKQDLQCLMPSVWWSGSCEGGSRESSMMLTNTALSGAIEKIYLRFHSFPSPLKCLILATISTSKVIKSHGLFGCNCLLSSFFSFSIISPLLLLMFQTRDRSRRRMRLFLVIASMGRVAAATTTTTTLESGVALRIARCEDEKVDPEKCQTRDPTVSVVNGRGKTINKCVFFEFEQSPELV